jgi:hypothetical protein
MHESGGDVHIHDDKTKTKFCMKMKKFKPAYDKLKTDLSAVAPTVFESEIEDPKGRVKLVAERDKDNIEWRLDIEQPVLVGFDEMDDFLGNY